MVEAMDEEGFGGCSNAYQCQAACPKGIKVENIARMNREYLKLKYLVDKFNFKILLVILDLQSLHLYTY